jgi:iron complex transport system substrate-binding protein
MQRVVRAPIRGSWLRRAPRSPLAGRRIGSPAGLAALVALVTAAISGLRRLRPLSGRDALRARVTLSISGLCRLRALVAPAALLALLAAAPAGGLGCRCSAPRSAASESGSASASPPAAPAGGSSAAGAATGSAGSAAAPAGALRIVSLTPSATEVIAALGAAGLLVGVDDYSSFPPEVRQLPRVGSFLAPNLETIVSLKPTLVIVDDIHGQTAGALHDAGIATAASAIHALPDVKAALRSVGGRIGKAADAERVVASIDAALDRAAAQRPARRPRVLAVIDREVGGLGNLVCAGPGSWVDELLAVVGGDNVLKAASVRYPKISTEEVLRAKPDVILDLSYGARDTLTVWDRLAVPAVTAHRVHALDDPFLVAPSPRVAAALTVLARILR